MVHKSLVKIHLLQRELTDKIPAQISWQPIPKKEAIHKILKNLKMYYKLPLRKLTDKITAQIILAANYLKTSSLSTQLPRDSLKNSKNGKKRKKLYVCTKAGEKWEYRYCVETFWISD